MVELLWHRGPDGSSVWDHDGVSMGHTHLRVTGDVKQPVIFGDKAVTYNGEIYNFGDFLSGTSDTLALADVILKDGVDSFLRSAGSINGDYAFAYYDGSRLLLARDPVGIKPLYYGKNDEGLAFASEKKALMRIGVTDIRALAPGSIYYDGAERPVIRLPDREPAIKDEHEAMAALDGALKNAVKLRAHKDAAVAFSGGVDCSVIGAMSGLPLCTVGLKDSFDIRAAKKAASLMNAEQRHFVYEITENDIEDELPNVIYAVESADPLKVSIAMPIYLLAREARKSGFKVLLSGQGADELFGGYARYEAGAGDGTLGEMLRHDLEHIAEVNLERDDAATMAHGVEMRVPYLDMGVISVAQRIDPSLKVSFDGKDYIRKYVLRKISETYLPREVSYAPKKAIQYGTSVQKVLERLAHKKGFKGINDHFQSLYKSVF